MEIYRGHGEMNRVRKRPEMRQKRPGGYSRLAVPDKRRGRVVGRGDAAAVWAAGARRGRGREAGGGGVEGGGGRWRDGRERL